MVQDPQAFQRLTDGGKFEPERSLPSLRHRTFVVGIDHLLAQHVAHLFVRDTLTLFEEKLNLDDTQDTDHFEVGLREGEHRADVERFQNINSTNWQSMRFKPPPVNSNIGWRVEFRPTEVMILPIERAIDASTSNVSSPFSYK